MLKSLDKTQIKEYRERCVKHKRCKVLAKDMDEALWNIIKDSYCLLSKKITLKTLADYRYSRYIRLSKSVDGICECITCKEKKHRTEMQNGHFKSRWFMKYRYMDDNCYPQCAFCNVIINWNYKKYTLAMIDKFWLDWVRKVENDTELYPFKSYMYVDIITKSFNYVMKHQCISSTTKNS